MGHTYHRPEEEERCDELGEPQRVEAVEKIGAHGAVDQQKPQRLQGSAVCVCACVRVCVEFLFGGIIILLLLLITYVNIEYHNYISTSIGAVILVYIICFTEQFRIF